MTEEFNIIADNYVKKLQNLSKQQQEIYIKWIKDNNIEDFLENLKLSRQQRYRYLNENKRNNS